MDFLTGNRGLDEYTSKPWPMTALGESIDSTLNFISILRKSLDS